MTNDPKMMKLLDKLYGVAIDGGGVLGTAEELANDYLSRHRSVREAASSLVKWQTAKAGSAGFVTGFGGLATMAVALPANMTSNIIIQLRMAAAIAHMNGYDVRSDQVKTFAISCLAGNSIKEILREVGIEVAKKVSAKLIARIPGSVLVKINQKIGFRLMTKFGTRGAANLGKAIPIIGAVAGAAIDASYTRAVGNAAIALFLGA